MSERVEKVAVPMLRLARRRKRKIAQVARLLVELDAASREKPRAGDADRITVRPARS